MKKDKSTNNDLQNIAQKMKHWATQTSLKTGMNLCAQEGLSVPDPLVAPVMLLLNETNIV